MRRTLKSYLLSRADEQGCRERQSFRHDSVYLIMTFWTAILLAYATPSYAKEPPPLPAHKKEAVEALEVRIKAEEKKEKILKDKIKKIEKDLSFLKKRLVSLASKIQTTEQEIHSIETDISNLQEEKAGIEKKLEEQYGSMSHMVLALQRIRRVPPQALIARKTSPVDTARTALLLKKVLPALEKQASALRQDAERLTDIEKDLDKKRESVLAKMAGLETKQDEMKELLAERKRTYKSTSAEHKQQEISIKKISQQASDLKDLITKLENANAKQNAFDNIKKKKSSPKKKFVVPSGNKHAQLPVSGIIEVSYGGKDSIGAVSEGLYIKSRKGALVTAPMSGVIRYAGPFKNYKNLLIIEHEDNYHSLVAGFSKIDTVVGQTVITGEPVGILGSGTNDTGDDNASSLYYELRFKGQPVNPKRKFSELQS